jgi:hypothetical protein
MQDIRFAGAVQGFFGFVTMLTVGAALVAALIVNANTGTAWAKEGQNQHCIRLS